LAFFNALRALADLEPAGPLAAFGLVDFRAISVL
jgi:hypothetical protein